MVVRQWVYAGMWLMVGAVVAQGVEPPTTVAAPAAPAQEVSPAQIDALVRQLADPVFQQRENATAELTRIGMPARPALAAAGDSADAEVRDRARRILVIVDREDQERRIADFLADVEGRREHDLPGWKRFREAVGSDRAAHELFAGMLRAEGELISALDGDPKQLQQKFLARLQALQRSTRMPRLDGASTPIPLESMAALIFVGSDPNVKLTDSLAAVMYSLMHQSAFLRSIDRNDEKSVHRSLLRLWILRDQWAALQYSLNLSMQFNLNDEGAVLAEKAIVDVGPQGTPPHAALLMLGRFGSAKHVKLLEPLLDNKTVLWSGKVKKREITGQVRDVSLAVMVSLTGQDLDDYGFKSPQGVGRLQSNLAGVGFFDDSQRDVARAKWQEWKSKQPVEPKSTNPK